MNVSLVVVVCYAFGRLICYSVWQVSGRDVRLRGHIRVAVPLLTTGFASGACLVQKLGKSR